ncbi:MAG: glycine cleavage system protein T [Euryarchaeota archaeon]|nr:glycine cleavage system protein T [Euryarchaeota archaeon]
MGDTSAKLLRTACYDQHVVAGANLVNFHGFELPMWYTSIREEHIATRTTAGLFDVSHMGFFCFSGKNVSKWLESLATQKVSSISEGRCAYTHFLDSEGSIIDDMIFAVTNDQEISAFRKGWETSGDETILGVPNASMIEVMWDWFHDNLPEDGTIKLENLSEQTSILALQGPNAKKALISTLGVENHIGRFKCQAIKQNDLGISGWIQGTGYTGESGYEIFIPNSQAELLWIELLKDHDDSGVVPVGLGARDTLRLEKGYLLSGQDFYWPGLGDIESHKNLVRNTMETQVPFGLDLDHDFVGKKAMLEKESQERLWGLKYEGRGPSPRLGHIVYMDDDLDSKILGIITSGAPSPSLENKGIAMGYFSDVESGQIVYVAASKRKLVAAKVIVPPFI